MKDLISKSLSIGIGIISMTKDKIEELANKVAEDAKMSESEGKKFIKEIVDFSDNAKDKIEKEIDKKLDEKIKQLGIATKEDIGELATKEDIDKLKEQISKLKK